jgi:pre-mRNA-splicing factor CWC22
VSEADQITHFLSLADEGFDPEDKLSELYFLLLLLPCDCEGVFCADVFQHDPEYEDNEQKYRMIKEEILGEDGEEGSSEGEGDSEEDSEDEDESDEGMWWKEGGGGGRRG